MKRSLSGSRLAAVDRGRDQDEGSFIVSTRGVSRRRGQPDTLVSLLPSSSDNATTNTNNDVESSISMSALSSNVDDEYKDKGHRTKGNIWCWHFLLQRRRRYHRTWLSMQQSLRKIGGAPSMLLLCFFMCCCCIAFWSVDISQSSLTSQPSSSPSSLRSKNSSSLHIQVFATSSIKTTVRLPSISRMINHDEITKSSNSDDDDDSSESSYAKWYYYAFDDDGLRDPQRNMDDDSFQKDKFCRRTNWHYDTPVDCNSIHEFNMLGKIESGFMTYLTEGGFREVYLSDLNAFEAENNKKVAFKSMSLESSDSIKYDIEEMRNDANINDKLSFAKDKIVQIYGYCGIVSINEAMMYGDLFELVQQPEPQETPNTTNTTRNETSTINPIDPNDDESDSVFNNTVLRNFQSDGYQKLSLALEMAEALQVLHAYQGGVIVHDDIKPSQFLVTYDDLDGTNPKMGIKLNDFNRAEIMFFDEYTQQYCPYRNDAARGNWRAPEEYNIKPLNEQIDIWSLGSSYYGLLTGYRPFKSDNLTTTGGNRTSLTRKEIKLKLKMGDMDLLLDPKYCQRGNYGERKMCEAMKLCWEYDPIKRIDIFGIVDFLKNATDNHPALRERRRRR